MSKPEPLSDELTIEIENGAKAGLFNIKEVVALCAQSREANALRETVAALTDLDQFDIAASKAGVSGTIKGAGAGLMAAILAKPLLDSDAPNYVEGRFTIVDPKTSLLIELVHTIQRVTGKTPHEKRQEAEEALAQARHDWELTSAGYQLERWAVNQVVDAIRAKIGNEWQEFVSTASFRCWFGCEDYNRDPANRKHMPSCPFAKLAKLDAPAPAPQDHGPKGDPRQPWFAAWQDSGKIGTQVEQSFFREGFHAAAPHADPWALKDQRPEHDEAETIQENPKSWAAWKREAERLGHELKTVVASLDVAHQVFGVESDQRAKENKAWAAQTERADAYSEMIMRGITPEIGRRCKNAEIAVAITTANLSAPKERP
jgi:hypothetical protein